MSTKAKSSKLQRKGPTMRQLRCQQLMMGMEQPARLHEIAERSHISYHEARLRLPELKREGLVESERARVYWLTPKGRRLLEKLRTVAAEKPDPDSLQQRLWNALRQPPQRHSIFHLLTMAVRADDPDAADRSRAWFKQLESAGIVALLPGNANFPDRWLLLDDLGVHAPSWRDSLGVLFDWNSGRALQLEGLP